MPDEDQKETKTPPSTGQPEERSSIEELEQHLYSRSGASRPIRRRRFRKPLFEVASKFKEREERPPKRRNYSTLVILLGVSLLFFVIAVGIASITFFGNSNVVSAKNIDIEVTGPIAHPAGEELVLQVAIVNRNTASLELADLIIEFPEGTRSASNISIDLPRTRESLGTIAPGERIKTTLRAVLFGEEDTTKQISFTIEYRIAGSNAIFFKEDVHEVLLSSAPLSIAVEALDEVISGQQVQFDVLVKSNSENKIEDVLLQAEYPFGFEFVESNPETTYDTTGWNLGTLSPGTSKRVTITGTLTGQNQEERVFRFKAGIQDERNEQQVSAEFGAAIVPVFIKRPFISLDLALNGNTAPEVISKRGVPVRGDLTWTNNLSVPVTDVRITISLAGSSLDQTSVGADEGFYRSLDNTITWSPETLGSLAHLNPGDKETVSFSFESFGLESGATFVNPEISVTADVAGRRSAESGVPESIRTTISRLVQFESDLLLSPRAVYTVGPFQNTGPLPPRADQETTYTIIWTVTNSSNSVSNARVFAALPSYVQWVGNTSPAGEDISFNPVGGIVTWDLGSVSSGVGYTAPTREVAFQVSLIPSLSQVGQQPVLIRGQTIEGLDLFTNTTIGSNRSPLTTNLSTDPNASSGHQTVTQ